MSRRQRAAGRHGAEYSQPGVARDRRNRKPGHGADEHHTLHTQVEDTAALRQKLSDRGEDQGRPRHHGHGEERDDLALVHRLTWRAARVCDTARRRRTRRRRCSLASPRNSTNAWIMSTIAACRPAVRVSPLPYSRAAPYT